MDRPPMERAMSTDVVMGIVMSHLKVRDLLNCRKVSKCWNRAASSVLRRRSTMIKNISSEAELIELGKCMRESSDFPFAGLKFLEPWRLSSAGVIEFFRNHGHGPRFTSLHLGVSLKSRIQDLASFMNNLPRLSILEVSDSWEPTLAPDAGLLKHAAGQDDGSILNLPSLRTLRMITYDMNQDFLRHVCTAASPSLQIECLNATHGSLVALERVGKLQAVSKIYQKYEWGDPKLGEEIFLSTESLTLTKLDFNAHGCMSVDGLKKILILSQHTLKDLCLARINPSWFSLECSVLTKLTTLSIGTAFRSYEYVFQGCQGSKFPALKELKLDFNYRDRYYLRSSGNFSDDLFIVPSLTKIDLNGPVDMNVIEDLARNFPNVVEIRLKLWYFGNDNDPNGIWRSLGAFKFLEKLKIWDYTISWPNKQYMSMDRFLTGIPNYICKNLCKHAQQNLMDSAFNEILRESPSILQVKNLKELVVCVKLDDELKEFPEEPPFIFVVSVWYALQMMPNLEAKFVYDYSEPSWGFKEEKREKAVTALKSAFKHVQPYVELEPFFY